MAAEPLVDRDVVELPVLEEAIPLEDDYVKDILPLPRSHATAPMWTIYSPESALSSSCAAADREPRGQDGGHRGDDLGSLAMEEPALD